MRIRLSLPWLAVQVSVLEWDEDWKIVMYPLTVFSFSVEAYDRGWGLMPVVWLSVEAGWNGRRPTFSSSFHI